MKRTQIQLDEETYERLRKTAYERHVSVAKVIRDAVADYLVGEGKQPKDASQPEEPKRKLTLADFPWVGMAHDYGPPPDPNSMEWGDVAYEEYLEESEEYRRLHADPKS